MKAMGVGRGSAVSIEEDLDVSSISCIFWEDMRSCFHAYRVVTCDASYSRMNLDGSAHRLCYLTSRSLSHSELRDFQLVPQGERCVLLDMSGVDVSSHHFETRILRYFYRLQFSSVKLLLNPFQGASNCPINSRCCNVANIGTGVSLS